MRLFTPVSEEEAAQLIGGKRDGEMLHWQTAVVPDEAGPDAVWVTVEVDADLIADCEQHYPASPGYREYRLAPALLIDSEIAVAATASG